MKSIVISVSLVSIYFLDVSPEITRSLFRDCEPTLCQSAFAEIVEPNQTDPAVVYISVDGGTSWKPFDNGIPKDATVSSFLVRSDVMFAATDNHGVYSVTEGESEWDRIDKDLPDHIDINAISAVGNSLIIGTLNHGILLSENGKNWRQPAGQINGTSIRSLHNKEGILLAGTDHGIYKSTDHGNTWKNMWRGAQVNGFTEMNNILYAALSKGAAMSIDNGASWKYIYELHTLHDISTDGESIYVMTLGGGLKRSVNSGLSWENVNSGLGTFNFYTFELKEFGNRLFAAQWHGIYQSDNLGKSWSVIANGLPDSTAFTTLEATRSGLIAGIGLRNKK